MSLPNLRRGSRTPSGGRGSAHVNALFSSSGEFVPCLTSYDCHGFQLTVEYFGVDRFYFFVLKSRIVSKSLTAVVSKRREIGHSQALSTSGDVDILSVDLQMELFKAGGSRSA